MFLLQITDKEGVGTIEGWIYNKDKSGEAPNLADQSSWLVTLKDEPDDVKKRYTHSGGDRDWYKDPTFRVVALS